MMEGMLNALVISRLFERVEKVEKEIQELKERMKRLEEEGKVIVEKGRNDEKS